MRLITGPPAPDPGPHVRYPHRLRGSTAWSRGPMVRPDISNGTSRGPASCGLAHLARNDPPVEWPAGRHCCHPAPVPHGSAAVSKQAAAGLIRAADSRPGRATAAYSALPR
jgi:hypothetical protein